MRQNEYFCQGKAGAPMTLIVFDIGNVLLRWDPQAAFRHALDSDAAIDAVLHEVGFYDWNYEQDRGRSRAEAVAAIAAHWPHHADLMDGYFDRFGLTIQHRIQGSWDIATALKDRGYRLWALTNFSADTWPQAQRLQPTLLQELVDALGADTKKSGCSADRDQMSRW
jgi:2-haloacid dehalogenase